MFVPQSLATLAGLLSLCLHASKHLELPAFSLPSGITALLMVPNHLLCAALTSYPPEDFMSLEYSLWMCLPIPLASP